MVRNLDSTFYIRMEQILGNALLCIDLICVALVETIALNPTWLFLTYHGDILNGRLEIPFLT